MLNEQTLIERAIQTVAPYCAEIIVGLRAKDLSKGPALASNLTVAPTVTFVEGGATRQETVQNLVERATRPLVLLHEVVRPFVRNDLFASVLQASAETGAAALYVPLRPRDGLAIVDSRNLRSMLPRNQVAALQTPHAYRRDWLVEAHRRAARESWVEESTVALVKRAGYEIQLILSDDRNFKITYPEDWERAVAEANVPVA